MSRRRRLLPCALVLSVLVLVAPARAQEAPPDSDFQVTTLAKGADKTGEPIAMAVLPDRSVLHTSRDGRVWRTTAERDDVARRHDPRLLARRGRPAGHRDRRRLRDEPLGLRLLRAAALDTPAGDAPSNGAGPATFDALQGPQPALAHEADRGQHARPRDRAADPPGPGRPRHLLPRRRRDRLRRRGQPLPLHGRRRQPVRVRRLHADRRAAHAQPGLRRAALAPPTPTTCAASCCASRSTPTAPTRLPAGNLFPPARWARGPRSTRWASATRSASRSTTRPAGSTSATTAPTRAARARPAAPAARSSST